MTSSWSAAENGGGRRGPMRRGTDDSAAWEEAEGEGADGEWHEGMVKSFDDAKGFGFVKSSTVYETYGCDAFLHYKQVGDSRVGDSVRFVTRLNAKGQPQAYNLTVSAAAAAGTPAQMTSPGLSWAAPPTQAIPAIGGGSSSTRTSPPGAWVGGGAPGDLDASPSAVRTRPAVATGGSSLGSITAPSSLPYEGVVEHYDEEKGFGFIRNAELQEQYGVSVFFHRSKLHNAAKGDRVYFSLNLIRGKPAAAEIRRKEAPLPFTGSLAKCTIDAWLAPDRKPELEQQGYDGQIKSFDEVKGYGFIVCPELSQAYGSDVFVHQSQLKGFSAGDRVKFNIRLSHQGKPQAHDLRSAPRRASDLGLLGGPLPAALVAPQESSPTAGGSVLAYAPPSTQDATCGAHVTGSSAAASAAAGSNGAAGADDDEEFTGRVKTFDWRKGCGYIHCPEAFNIYRHDVFVHQRQLGDCIVGDTVRFSVRIGKKSLPQATRLIKCPVNDVQDDEYENVDEAESQLVHQGVIKMVNVEKGFGFIQCSTLRDIYNSDIFVDAKNLDGFEKGDNVAFCVRVTKRGKPQAVRLRPGEGDDDEAESETKVLIGTIKSFDKLQGYGFVSCPEINESHARDAFLHESQIKGFKPGDHVAFSMRLNDQGNPQAYNLHDAPASVGWLAIESDVVKKMDEDEEYEGVIKSFSVAHGYGFVGCQKLFDMYERDVFIQQSEYTGLGIGDTIAFTAKVRKGMPKVTAVVRHVSSLPAGGPRGVDVQRNLGDLTTLDQPVLDRRFLRACQSAKAESVGDVKQLLEAKADPSARDVTDQLGLMVCALNVRHGERKCRILMEHRADPGAMANENKTVVEWARERINPRFALFLEALRKGEDTDCFEVILDRQPGGDEL